MTPMQAIIATRIKEQGPISVAGYMYACLGHPDFGYYMSKDPFGRGGDFITAPEVSQMFGEMLGLWILAAWQSIGSPAPFTLMELGPGRGTLMADAMRAATGFPDFAKACQLHLVEISPVLRSAQADKLKDCGQTPQWHETVRGAEQASQGPIFMLGNEFLDALPIHQFQLTKNGWRERMVGLAPDMADGLPIDNLCYVLSNEDPPPAIDQTLRGRTDEIGAIAEICPTVVGTVKECAHAISTRGGMALFVDYGHGQSAAGETFQAVMDHKPVSTLEHAGEADLTAHVDFEAVARSSLLGGATPFGPLTQGEFLTRIGMPQRAIKLTESNPGHAESIQIALDRLIEGDQMGSLFKVMALSANGVTPPGYEADEAFAL